LESGRFGWEWAVLQLYGLTEEEIVLVGIKASETLFMVVIGLIKARLKKVESLKSTGNRQRRR
jgi:hypothetical protein